MGSGYVSHCWTSATEDHLDHRFIFFKKCRASHQIEKTSRLRKHNRRCIIQDRCAELESLVGCWYVFFIMCHAASFPAFFSLDFLDWLEEECHTSRTRSQRSRAGIPYMRKPASREMISASVELCETEVCFSHIQLIRTNVCLPNKHNILLRSILRVQGLRPSQSPETVAVCIVVPCFTHDKKA